MKRPSSRIAVSVAAGACLVGTFAFASPGNAAQRPRVAEPTLVEGPFHTTPGTYTDVVPAGVTTIAFEVTGASCGNGGHGDTVTVGGGGDDIKGTIAVTPGQVLTSIVGAHGNEGCRVPCSGNSTAGIGGAGFSKGGDGSASATTIGGGGGGASSLSINGASPFAVGAGGGGGGFNTGQNGLPNSSPGTGNDGGAGDDGGIPSGSGGGGGGAPGGPGGAGGNGGQAGVSVGTSAGTSSLLDGDVQIGYYEPGLDAEPDDYSVKVGTTLVVPAPGVLKNDTAFGLHPTIARSAQHGAVSLASDGGFTYKPALGFAGYDTFTYALQDADRRQTGIVTILVGKVAAGALTSIGVPGQGRVLLGLACGPTAKCPFDVAILKRVGNTVRRIVHGQSTYAPRTSALLTFTLPKSTRLTYGTGKNHAVHATLYITLHRKGQRVIVIAERSITIK